MKSKVLLNLALLAIVSAIAAFVLLQPEKEPAPTKPLAAIDANGLASITLKNEETIVFEKRDGHWRIIQPLLAPANDIRVRQLIDIAKIGREAEYPLNPDDLAKFELDKPKAELTLGDQTFAFGGSDPINLRRFVKAGNSLVLVDDDFFHHLTAQATDYVEKKLIPEGAKLKEFKIPGIQASLTSDGKWTGQPADKQAAFKDIATAWSTVRAIDVRKIDKPASGDAVALSLADGTTLSFIVVQREPDIVMVRPDLGLRFELTGDISRQLLNLPKLPDPTPLPPPDNTPATDEDTDESAPPPPDDDAEEGSPETSGPDGEDMAPDAGEDPSAEPQSDVPGDDEPAGTPARK